MAGFGICLLFVVALAFGATALDSRSSSEHGIDDCGSSLVCETSPGPLAGCGSFCGHPHQVVPVATAGVLTVVTAIVVTASSGQSAVVVRSSRRLDRPPQLLV